MSESWKIDAFITLNWKARILNRTLAGENVIKSFLCPSHTVSENGKIYTQSNRLNFSGNLVKSGKL